MIEAMGPQALVAAVMSDVGLTGGPSARAEEDRPAAGFLVVADPIPYLDAVALKIAAAY